MKVLEQGAPIHGSNGVMFDTNNRLFIASMIGNEIIVMNPETGRILERFGLEHGVKSPDDLTFGPDGSLYWTSLLTGEVGRLTTEGVKTGQNVQQGVNPITFSDDGRLFVGVPGDGIYELDPYLIKPPRFMVKDPGSINGFDFGPDGFLYAPVRSKGEVVRIDVDNGSITTVAGGFGSPVAVKFDSRNRLFVVDTNTGQVVHVDRVNGKREIIIQITPGLDNLAFDSQDRMYVSHFRDGSVFEVFTDGSVRTVSPGGLILPGGVAVLLHPGGESVFVADYYMIHEFNGQTGEKISSALTSHPGISNACTITSEDGILLTSRWMWSNVVQAVNPNTCEVKLDIRDLKTPLNAIYYRGDIIIAEYGEKRIIRVHNENPNNREVLAAGFEVPAGLAATDENVWAGDWATGTIYRIIANSETLAKPEVVVKGLNHPEGMAVASDGNLLVVESGDGCLSYVDLTSGQVSIIAKIQAGFPGLSDYPPTNMFTGVAVGPSGVIYVTGDIENILYRLDPIR
ncbi:MAG: SMP-30/gluconolactonase/LRE family protein [Candidatus Latescibacteria bacterium]|nr:SMP-30/gluconolactonase/LRE family protein [Candidatus Latescibacterota bacterium]